MSERATAVLTATPTQELNFATYSPAAFDASVAASMRQGYSPIRVDFNDAFQANDPPAALIRWISAVERTNGQVVACPSEPSEALFADLIPWLVELADVALDMWTFRPAANYNVVAFKDFNANTVNRVEFWNRNGEPPC